MSQLGLAVVSGMIGTEIVWLSVPGLKVSVPDVACSRCRHARCRRRSRSRRSPSSWMPATGSR